MHSVFQSLCNNRGFFFQHFHIFNGTFHISLVLTGFFVKFSKDFQLFVGFFLSNNLKIGIIVKKNSWKSNSFNNARKPPKKRFIEFCICLLHFWCLQLLLTYSEHLYWQLFLLLDNFVGRSATSILKVNIHRIVPYLHPENQ